MSPSASSCPKVPSCPVIETLRASCYLACMTGDEIVVIAAVALSGAGILALMYFGHRK